MLEAAVAVAAMMELGALVERMALAATVALVATVGLVATVVLLLLASGYIRCCWRHLREGEPEVEPGPARCMRRRDHKVIHSSDQ